MDALSSDTIKNSFKKADLHLNLEGTLKVTMPVQRRIFIFGAKWPTFKQRNINIKCHSNANEEIDSMELEILRNLESLNISINKDELEQFVYVDDESSEEFTEAILEDVEDVLTSSPIEDGAMLSDDNDRRRLHSSNEQCGL